MFLDQVFLIRSEPCYSFAMTAVTDLFRQAADLSEEDRATLAGLLIESLESELDPDADTVWGEELKRRLAELDRGGVTIPWETVRAK